MNKTLRKNKKVSSAAKTWCIQKISDCGEMNSGGTPSTSNPEYWDGNIPWISSSDLTNNNIHSISITKFITEDAIKNSATKKVSKDSILVVNRVLVTR